MNWVLLSVLSAILGSFWSLSVKYGLLTFDPASFSGWYSLGAAVLVMGFVFYKTRSLKVNKWGAGAGIASGITTALAATAFSIGPNPGFCMALIRMQAVLTAVASHFIWGAPLTKLNILGMVLACVGVALLVLSGSVKKHVEKKKVEKKDKRVKKEEETDHVIKKSTNPLVGYEWVIVSLLGGISMTGKDLFTKTGLIKDGKEAFMDLFWSTAFFSVIAIFIYVFLKNKSFELKSVKPVQDYYEKAGYYIGLASLAFALYQFTVIAASKEAPNVGFVKSIDTLGIILTSIVSYYEFGSHLDAESVVGMLLIVTGACAVSYGGQLPFMNLPIIKEADKVVKRMFDGLSWGGASSNAHGLKSNFGKN